MSKRRFSIGYFVLEQIVAFSRGIFYKRFSFINRKRLPGSKTPVILVCNHQNGMMDPFMTCCSFPRQLSWLTRADIFKEGLADKVLRHLNMIPVYRPRDEVDDLLDKNKQAFGETFDRISRGNIIAMFPEGNHNWQKKLRPMKKGLARIVFGIFDREGPDFDLHVVPCGIDYTRFNKFRGDLILNMGHPIPVKDIYKNYSDNRAVGSVELMKIVSQRLGDLMVNLRQKDLYEPLEYSRFLALDMLLSRLDLKRSQYNEFLAYQHLIKTIESEELAEKEDVETFIKLGNEYKSKLHKIDLHPEDLEHSIKASRRKLILSLVLLLLSPLALIGFAINLLPIWLVHYYVKQNIKDIHFKSSIMFFISVFLFPIFWILTGCIIWATMGHWIYGFLFLPVALICGIIALNWWEIFNILKNALRLRGDNFKGILEVRENIRSVIGKLI